MKRDTVNYLVVGLFVTAILAAFFIMMVFITGRAGPSDHYFARYENVTGIKFGTGVFYEGYRVGQVESVEPVPAPNGMRYKVSMTVAKDWRIPADSHAEVITAGLISQVQIEIREGISTELLIPGSEITGVQQVDLFSALSEAASGFNDLSATGVTPVLRNLNKRISQVADQIMEFRRDELSPLIATLNHRIDDELAPQALTVLRRLDASSARLDQFLGPDNEAKVGQFLDNINSVAVNLNELVERLETTRARMDGVLVHLDGVILNNEGDITDTVKGARRSLAQMETALTTVNERIESVMYNLDGSARQMHELTRALRENPTRILRTPATSSDNTP
ncbi:MAG: MCE family protein [Gammaproteobacteria bacterium]|nr:MCE family protein [Gammaproteobacteria bacterium]